MTSTSTNEDKFVILADKEKDVSETVKKENHLKLENVNWAINVTTATEKKRNIMEPHALLRLYLKDQITNDSSITTLDFNEGECIKFYQVLENIQGKLDDVYKE